MGYYAAIIESDFHISRECFEDAFLALRELNGCNDLKTGGHHPANLVKPADSSSLGDPNKWFAYMDWNYDETCHSVREVLEQAGFAVEEDDWGICSLQFEYQKCGQEEFLLSAVAPFVKKGGYIVFEGEDDSRWGYRFDGDRMVECDVTLTLEPRSISLTPSLVADEARRVAGGIAASIAVAPEHHLRANQ